MEFAIELGLDTLSYSLSLLLVALGLVVIFGLMNVINMALIPYWLSRRWRCRIGYRLFWRRLFWR